MRFLFFCGLCGLFQTCLQSPLSFSRLAPEVIKVRIIKILEKATPSANVDTLMMMVKQIAQLLARVEAPAVQNSPFDTDQEKRALEKIYLCRNIMIHLRDKTPPPTVSNCHKCVSYPDTRRLLYMLEEVDEKVLGEMDTYIGRVLVNTAFGLQCMLRDEPDWMSYKINLNINIGRLNLKWD